VSDAAKVRDEWCEEYTKARDLLLACRHAVVIAMQQPMSTDWTHMIAAIDKLTGYERTSATEQK
jgi:hypothetical protein